MFKFLMRAIINVSWFVGNVLLCLYLIDFHFKSEVNLFNSLVLFFVSLLTYSLKELIIKPFKNEHTIIVRFK